MERLITLSILIACCSCTAEMKPDYPKDDYADASGMKGTQTGKWVDIRLNVSAQETGKIDTADFFVYDDDLLRRLDSYQRTVIDGETVKVACTSGPKILAGILNGHTGKYMWNSNNSFAYIESLSTEFRDESASRPTMSGVVLLNGQAFDGIGDSGTELHVGTELTLTPLMSQICLRSIRCDFTDRAYEGVTLDNARAYLTNVSSICRIFQESDFTTRGTINTGRLVKEDLERLPDPSMLFAELPTVIGKDFIETNICLYCYPNTNIVDQPTSPFTRLVIEGKIDNVTWYWPIDINRESICWVEGCPGVERGKKYEYDITIKRSGSQDPDSPVSPTDVSIGCMVTPWKEEARNEVF